VLYGSIDLQGKAVHQRTAKIAQLLLANPCRTGWKDWLGSKSPSSNKKQKHKGRNVGKALVASSAAAARPSAETQQAGGTHGRTEEGRTDLGRLQKQLSPVR